jgi:hypothetical protein
MDHPIDFSTIVKLQQKHISTVALDMYCIRHDLEMV